MTRSQPGDERLYADLAEWWPVLTAEVNHAAVAANLLALARAALGGQIRSLLELGSGVGPLAAHFPPKIQRTLVDRSAAMLAVSRRINPQARHVEADLRTLTLDQEFDVVLLHDAVMYLTTSEDLQLAMHTMARHLRPGGVAIVVPDVVRESFQEGHVAGGGALPDGRAARILEWHWDPDPRDDTFRAEMSFLLRDASGHLRAVHETHTMGLFSRAQLGQAMGAAGLQPVSLPPRATRAFVDVFVGGRPGPSARPHRGPEPARRRRRR